MEHCIMQNSTVDINEKYFVHESLSTEEDSNLFMEVISTFRDPVGINRRVSQISWHPEGPEKFVVSHKIRTFLQRTDAVCFDGYIWLTENASSPISTLRSQAATLCLKFNPKDTNIIAGGLYNGQVSFWDIRQARYPIISSGLNTSHLDAVHKCTWTTSKSGTQVLAVSIDGEALVWDMRNISQPVEQYYFDQSIAQDVKSELGGLSLDFDPTIPTKFMVGAASGKIVICNRKAKSSDEKVTSVYEKAHIGPIYAIQRSTFNPKLFLTVGDRKAKIWCEDVKDVPIISTCDQASYLYDACWSPVRPFVFFACTEDGHISAWDHMHKYREPLASMKVSDVPLRSLSIQEQGRLLAVGSSTGTTTIVGLSNCQYTLRNNQENLFTIKPQSYRDRYQAVEDAYDDSYADSDEYSDADEYFDCKESLYGDMKVGPDLRDWMEGDVSNEAFHRQDARAGGGAKIAKESIYLEHADVSNIEDQNNIQHDAGNDEVSPTEG